MTIENVEYKIETYRPSDGIIRAVVKTKPQVEVQKEESVKIYATLSAIAFMVVGIVTGLWYNTVL